MEIFIAGLLIIIAYLIGSIPNALIISKISNNIDIRNFGSKNMGATNAYRVLGPLWGGLVFLLDALKASLLVLLVKYQVIPTDLHPLILGAASIIGHLFPIYVKFKGGKGVACTAGVLLAYAPLLFVVMIITFMIVFMIKKYVSLGSIVSLGVTLIGSFWLPIDFSNNRDPLMWVFCCFAFISILFTHRTNIVRLIKKQETRLKYQKELKSK